MLPLKEKKMMILCIVCVYWVPRQVRKARTRQFLPAVCPCRTPGTRRERGKRRSKESWPETLRFESIPCTQNQSHSVSHADLLCLLPFFQICPCIFYVFPLLPHFLGGFILIYFNLFSFFWYLGNCHVLDTNSPFDNIVLITLFIFFENNYG